MLLKGQTRVIWQKGFGVSLFCFLSHDGTTRLPTAVHIYHSSPKKKRGGGFSPSPDVALPLFPPSPTLLGCVIKAFIRQTQVPRSECNLTLLFPDSLGLKLTYRLSSQHCSPSQASLCTAKYVLSHFKFGTLPPREVECEVTDGNPWLLTGELAGLDEEVLSKEDRALLMAMRSIGLMRNWDR
jgi:hypothetical protein